MTTPTKGQMAIENGQTDEYSAGLSRFAQALEQLEERQASGRESARRFLIRLVKDADEAIAAPVDRVALETNISIEEAQLALASLLADGTLSFTDDYRLSLADK